MKTLIDYYENEATSTYYLGDIGIVMTKPIKVDLDNPLQGGPAYYVKQMINHLKDVGQYRVRWDWAYRQILEAEVELLNDVQHQAKLRRRWTKFVKEVKQSKPSNKFQPGDQNEAYD